MIQTIKNNLLATKYLLVANIVLLVISYLVLWSKCFGIECDVYLFRGYIKPVYWLLLSLLPTTIYLMSWGRVVVNKWLVHVAVWYFPLIFISLLSTPIFSSNIMHIGRSMLAIGFMTALFLITVIYTLVLWRKGKKSVK